MGIRIKQYLSPRLIYPIHDNPTLFIASEWQHDKTVPNIIYLLYRISIFAAFFVSWAVNLAKQSQKKWVIYLTNWGYTLCTLEAILGLTIVLLAYVGMKLKKPRLNKVALSIYPVYWTAITTATPVAFVITVVYWTLIHNVEKSPVDALNVLVHGTNSLLMMLELWIVAFPIRIIHMIYPVAIGVSYTIFSVIYYSAGGTSRDGLSYIYPILRWDKPGTTVLVCLGVMVFIVVLHCVAVFVCYVRMKLYQFIFCRQKDLATTELKGCINQC